MLIIGAKGLAKEVLELCKNLNYLKDLVFYDNINRDSDLIYNQFTILHEDIEVVNYFKNTDKRFVLGLGEITHRIKLTDKFIALGGELTSLLSAEAIISTFDVSLGKGAVVMPGAIISNGVSLGQGCLVYFNTTVTHDVTVGKYSIIHQFNSVYKVE